MATDVIKTKELPIVGQQVDVTLYDRLVASHQVTSDMRATTGIPIGLLAERFMAQDVIGQIASKNLFGTDAPDSETGTDGDMYFQLEGSEVISVYVKYNGSWLLLALGDDNWSAFLAGQPFDLISMDAESVAAYAFYNNQNIRRVIMPNCKNVYDYAFAKSSVKNIQFDSIEHIWPYAFAECTEFYKDPPIHFDLRTCRYIDEFAFYKCRYVSSGGAYNTRLRDVETIGSHAFFDSRIFGTGLGTESTLNLPYCKTIGEKAFSAEYTQYSNTFDGIILPRVERLENRCFDMTDLSTAGGKIIRIGPYIEYMYAPFFIITDYTFYIEAVEPPELVQSLDGGTIGSTARIPLHIYVPAQSVDAYKEASVWSFYESVIEAIPEEVNANE